MRNVELTRLRKLLKKISSLLIVTHNNPDPDALGSAFALSVLAKNLKVRSNIFYGGFISRPENKRMVALLKIRPLLKKRVQSRDYQAVAFVDCQAAGRNHPLPEYEGAIEIDHHPRIRRRKGLISIVESGVGATATLLFEILMKMKVPISSPVATGLFYGIKTDTDNLSRGTTNRDIEAYSHLFSTIDKRKLALIEHPERSRYYYSLLMKGLKKGRIVSSFAYTRLKDITSPTILPELADLFINIKGVNLSLVLGEKDGIVHFSIRSREKTYNAGELAQALTPTGEAGGHEEMGGGRIRASEPGKIIAKLKKVAGIRGEERPLLSKI